MTDEAQEVSVSLETFRCKGCEACVDLLPDVFGWLGAVVIQLLIIACLWVAADLWERKKMGVTGEE